MPRPNEETGGAGMPGRPPRNISFWPREHGAYVQLLGPLACAALFGPRSLMALLLTAAACAAFLAHEPLLILLGRRGERARSQCGPAATRRVVVLGVAAVYAPFWFWSGDDQRALALAIPLLLSSITAGAVLFGHERTLPGQLLSATTLASFSIPVLVAAGLQLPRACEFALGWALVHLTAICAARAYVYRRKHGTVALTRATLFGVGLLAASSALFVAGLLPLSFALAIAPFVALSLLLTTRTLHFKSPKALGWTLTCANLIAVVVFGLELR